MKAVVYKIVNTINNDEYIGSSVQFEKRKYYHLNDLEHNDHHSQILQNSWNKYGAAAFEFVILEEFEYEDVGDILEKEQGWIDERKPRFNICKIVGSPLGIKHTDEARKNMSLAHIGKKLTDEAIRKRSLKQSGENHWTFGKSRSDEDRKKMSDGVKKYYLDGGIHHQKGKERTDEVKKKISEKLMKPVLQYSKDGILIREWKGIPEAEKELKINRVNINQCCNGKLKTSGGFIWKYKVI